MHTHLPMRVSTTIRFLLTGLLLALPMLAQPAWAVPLMPTTPDHAWLFDEGTGTTSVATYGGADAALLNGAGWTTDTPYAYAGNHSLFLDGSDDVAEVAGLNGALNGATAFSLSLWVQAASVPTDDAFFGGTDPSGSDTWGGRYDQAGWLNGNSTTNGMKFGLMIDGANYQYESGGSLQTTAWRHVLFVWESGSGPRLYVDGVLDTPSELSTGFSTVSGSLSDQTRFLIGDGAKSNWDGSIDEVVVWRSALTADNAEWLTANSAVALPEPGTGTLLLLGVVLAATTRPLRQKSQ